jgi:GxxExxY protein
MTEDKLIYKDLSYKICGFLFYIHNKLGRFSKEKNYADALEIVLKESNLHFTREQAIETDILSRKLNLYRTDFVVDGKVLLELKAKTIVTKDDYFQVLKYLKSKGLKLGLLVNFREKYLKPKRILNTLVD